MGVFNAEKRFRHSVRETALYSKCPKCVREVFNFLQVAEDGIFTIEKKNDGAVYDSCYLFTDVNYINRDYEEKRVLLTDLMKLLNSMTLHFKITMSREYQGVESFVQSITSQPHQEDYQELSQGLDAWIHEKIVRGEIRDQQLHMYLTLTVRAQTREEAKVRFYETETQLSRLFQNMSSTIRPLNGWERMEMLRAFFHPGDVSSSVNYDFGNPRHDPMNSCLPTTIRQEKSWMKADEQYLSVLFARDYDPSLDEGKVMHGFSSLPFTSLLTLDYAPVEKRDLKDMLEAVHLNNEKAIAQEEDSKRSRGQLAMGISHRKERRQKELESYMDQVVSNNESGFIVCLLFVVTADSQEELASRIQAVKQVGRENGVYMETCNRTQLKSLNTALPNGCRNISYPRSFLSSSLVALQPFYAQELQEEGGFFYGFNRTTHHLVFGNRKKLASPHGMIVGHTGSGKSFFIKETEVTQTLLCTDDDLIILDPQNEMQDVCQEFQGQFMDLTPRSSIHINPLEIPEEVFTAEDPRVRNRFIADQVNWFTSFCSVAMRNTLLTEEHYSLLGRALRRMYEYLFEQKKLKEQPTLPEVRRLLQGYMETATSREDAAIARRLYNSLEEYTEGAFDLFAHPSNMDIHRRLVVFGLANVPQQLWEPVMITVMHFLSNRLEYNRRFRRPTRLIIDETQEVCKNPSSAAMLNRAVVTYRKFGGIVTMALQNLTRALENEDLRDMFSNCGYKYFLDQGGVDAASLQQIQELSAVEFESLSEERPGYGLLVWGKKVILLDSAMSRANPLYGKFTTNFHELVEGGNGRT